MPATPETTRRSPASRGGLRCGLVGGVLGLALGLLSPTPAAAAGCPKGERWVQHEVVSGDTLSAIALTHQTSMRSIERQNPGLDRDHLRAGVTLGFCVVEPSSSSSSSSSSASSSSSNSSSKSTTTKKTPKSCGKGKVITEYKVRSGDVLGKIASRHGVSEEAVISRNSGLTAKTRNNLQVGEVLEICVDQRRDNAAAACGHRTPIFEHIVLPGDTLSEIAGRYGVRRRDLDRLNPRLRGREHLLQHGQRIRVCPEIAPRLREKLVHTVASGETVGSIAKTYGVTPGELIGFQNGHLKDPNALRVGQELIVWREGSIAPGFGADEETTGGALKSGVQLPSGSHYVVKRPNNAWGTASTIRLIQRAIANYARAAGGKGPKIHVGDISRKGGGKFSPHISHQDGHDVDIGYVLKGESADELRFLSANKNNLDAERTWKLVKAFLDTDQVRYIFMDYKVQELVYKAAKSLGESDATLSEVFQYPRGTGRTYGIIRHWRRHVNHFHVRFR